MFYIFGWGKETIKDYGQAIPAKCWNCHNDISYRLIHVRKWATFFFIPVLPYESKYYLSCDICSRRIDINNQQVNQIKQLKPVIQGYLSGNISEDEYKRYLTSANLPI